MTSRTGVSSITAVGDPRQSHATGGVFFGRPAKREDSGGIEEL